MYKIQYHKKEDLNEYKRINIDKIKFYFFKYCKNTNKQLLVKIETLTLETNTTILYSLV